MTDELDTEAWKLCVSDISWKCTCTDGPTAKAQGIGDSAFHYDLNTYENPRELLKSLAYIQTTIYIQLGSIYQSEILRKCGK